MASVAARINATTRAVPPWLLYMVLPLPGLWLLVTQVLAPGPDPVAILERGLGERALQLLLLGLCITPLRALTGIDLLRFRRAVGLVAFGYACAHLAVYVLLDNQLWWEALLKDLTKRPYIMVGMVAFLLIVPLAWTSRNSAIRRMGPRAWRRLHRLVYPAVILAALHYVLLQKSWLATEPLLYLAAAIGLVALRLPLRRARARA